MKTLTTLLTCLAFAGSVMAQVLTPANPLKNKEEVTIQTKNIGNNEYTTVEAPLNLNKTIVIPLNGDTNRLLQLFPNPKNLKSNSSKEKKLVFESIKYPNSGQINLGNKKKTESKQTTSIRNKRYIIEFQGNPLFSVKKLLPNQKSAINIYDTMSLT